MGIERKEVSKASAVTQLEFGLLKAPGIKLYKTTEDKDPPLATFDGKAGPTGGRLEQRYRDVPQAEVDEAIPTSEAKPASPLGDLAKVVEKMAGSLPDDGVERGPAPPFDAATVRETYLVEVRPSGAAVEILPEQIRRGLWIDGSFVDCEDQLESIEGQTKLETMTVESFIPVQNVPRERIVGSYFVAPEDGYGQKVCALLWAGLRGTQKAAIVRWTARSRQSIGVLVGRPDGLVVHKLVWAEKARIPNAAVRSVPAVAAQLSADELEATAGLLRAMTERGRAELDELRDAAVVMREDLHAAARAGKVQPVGKVEEPPAAEAAVSLLDALKASAAAA